MSVLIWAHKSSWKIFKMLILKKSANEITKHAMTPMSLPFKHQQWLQQTTNTQTFFYFCDFRVKQGFLYQLISLGHYLSIHVGGILQILNYPIWAFMGTCAILFAYQMHHKVMWFPWMVHSNLYQSASSHAPGTLLWSSHEHNFSKMFKNVFNVENISLYSLIL